MTDILIPLGHGSKQANIELRYCLRSIEKHLSNVGNVYLIGERPLFVKNVIHIKDKDISGGMNRHANILRKIRLGCLAPISEDFLFMNDDHFLLKQFDAGKFPAYWDLTLQVRYHKLTNSSPYRNAVINTFDYLKSIGKNTRNFDLHCPIVYNRKRFLDITDLSKLPSVDYGYCIKSLYGNIMNIEGTGYTDLKINDKRPLAELYSDIQNRPFFSIGDVGLDKNMVKLLAELYPNPSKYEK